ncbi:hypothetical protein E2C01_021830 [Portunus trituberculatus]|uniref:Uncharacterized protein n=1 Tax=Portunus trituberculatus TaxID=210409 RepID=A0A5B7E3M9_PORTR|nr:hypothetical protein [Portunus trituberculatus]
MRDGGKLACNKCDILAGYEPTVTPGSIFRRAARHVIEFGAGRCCESLCHKAQKRWKWNYLAARRGMARRGMAWRGVESCGLVWCGVVEGMAGINPWRWRGRKGYGCMVAREAKKRIF